MKTTVSPGLASLSPHSLLVTTRRRDQWCQVEMQAAINRISSTAVRRGLGSSIPSASIFTLPDLPYGYGELEPIISGEIMELHHSKHHNTYVTNLNTFSEQLAEAQQNGDVSKVISLQAAIKFNGGGHLNHSIFWENLAPPSKGGGGEPEGELAKLIDAKFGSFENMKSKLSASTVAVQGSGWGWLGYDKASDSVAIATCFNQDPLEATTGLVPLFGIDVWEHAYYLDYKNVRPDYVNAIWGLANWSDVAARLEAAKK